MKHKQELIDILMADAKIKGQYADYDGNTCAIGGIAVKFGWDPKPLRNYRRRFSSWYSNPNRNSIEGLFSMSNKSNMMKALKEAQEYFDLTIDQLQYIQHVNDAHSSTEQRHVALGTLISQWEEETK